MENNENPSLCSTCGRCCKSMPGVVYPHQLKEITLAVLNALLDGGYCFDYWEGVLPGYPGTEKLKLFYLRPKIKGREHLDVHPAWGGECYFLTPTGCRLTFEERPLECQDLIPGMSKCRGADPTISKRDCVSKWLPYNNLIQEVLEKRKQKP